MRVQLSSGQQPPQQLAQQVDGHQADQQRGSGERPPEAKNLASVSVNRK